MALINLQQLETVGSTKGAFLFVAGLCSRKTYPLTERVTGMIGTGVRAEEILVSTFAEKAAAELLIRVSTRLVENVPAFLLRIRDEGDLEAWNQVAVPFPSVKNARPKGFDGIERIELGAFEVAKRPVDLCQSCDVQACCDWAC